MFDLNYTEPASSPAKPKKKSGKPAKKKPAATTVPAPVKNKGGRPPEAGVARSQGLLVKLTPTEKADVGKVARRYDLTMSEFARRALAQIIKDGFQG